MTRLTVNGEAVRYALDPETPLLWALRDASNLTGTKYGCDFGDCGVCTVMIDGQAAKSCTRPLRDLEGAEVVTIEGLDQIGGQALREAWLREAATRCGQCEPGMLVALTALLRLNPTPKDEDLDAITTLCRCGIQAGALRALMAVAAPRRDQPTPSE